MNGCCCCSAYNILIKKSNPSIFVMLIKMFYYNLFQKLPQSDNVYPIIILLKQFNLI